MKFYKIYIELTNICGLSCSFCPSHSNNKSTMSLEFFDKIASQVKNYTNEIALHIVGDPMVLSNLVDYLDIAQKYALKVHITTSGFYMSNYNVLFHDSIKQVNFSLNSYNKNPQTISLQEYLKPIFSYINKKILIKGKNFVNLRLWNGDKSSSENEFNNKIYTILESEFDIKIDKNSKSFRVAPKVLINYDEYFEWPSLDSTHSSHNFCYGLSSHIGILNSGKVVPCCFDWEGVITLGNLVNSSLSDILDTQRVKEIKEGFSNNYCTEELCVKCSYKNRV